MLVDFLCEKELTLVEKACYGAAGVEKLHNLLTNGLVVTAEDCGAACLKEVYVLIAVEVVEVGTLCLSYADGEGIVEGEIVLYTAGDVLLCLGCDFL